MLAVCAAAAFGSATFSTRAWAQTESSSATVPQKEGGSATAGEAKSEEGAVESPFSPEHGTWLNGVARFFSGEAAPEMKQDDKGLWRVENTSSIRYDVVLITVLILIGLALAGYVAGKKVRLRPEGKPHSLANVFEAAVEGYYDYLVGIMGRDLALKHTPLIATFFFTILICNWIGLIPGLAAPTSNANVPVALAIVAFFATHIIAIREVGVKSWFMHFVGEPKWLAFLNFPLHLIGELIKPLSLAIRLLCNVFGEEMVIVQLTTLAVALLPSFLPIPFQFPMMALGVFFGALQALVFSTLLAIYISILSTHHDDHGGHGHVEHTDAGGREQIVAHPAQTSVA